MASSVADLSANLADNINTIVDQASVSFISQTFNNIWSELNGLMFLLVALYMVVMGFGVMRGMVATPVNTFVENLFKLTVIYALVSSWPDFSFYVVDVLTNSPDALAGVISGGSNSGASATSQVGDIYSQAIAIVNAIKEQEGWVLPYVLGGIVFLPATLMMAYGIFLIVLSKVAIAVLVGLGPLFILFLMFKVTRQMFEAWLKQIINYILVVSLTVSVLGLTTQVARSALGVIPLDGITLGHVVPVCVVFILMFLLLMQVQNIASSLAGGLSISTGGVADYVGRKMDRAASRAAGAATRTGYNASKSGVKKGYNTIKDRVQMGKIKRSE